MPIALVPAPAEAGTRPNAARQSATSTQAAVFPPLVLISGFCNPSRRRSERAVPRKRERFQPKVIQASRLDVLAASKPIPWGRATPMQYQGEASAPHEGFSHSALIYGADAAFMEAAQPFVEQGILAGEATLVAVQPRNVENLRAALGGEPEG